MAKLVAPYLFTWKDVEAKSDRERFKVVFEHIPDYVLMGKLEKQRKWGRDDYPTRPIWNSVLAGIVYQHQNIDSLRGELLRNGELPERVNSRFDVSFGFERHFICGLRKMETRVGLSLCVMLAMAVGWIKEDRRGPMRSLVKSPFPLDKAA